MRSNWVHTRDGLAKDSLQPWGITAAREESFRSPEVYGVGVETWGMGRVGHGRGQEGGRVAELP